MRGRPRQYAGGWSGSFHEHPGTLKVRCRMPDAATAVNGDNARMDIQLNGETLAVPDHTTLAALLEARQLARRRVAVEINGEIVPRSRHGEHVLAPGDRVEIVHALGGG